MSLLKEEKLREEWKMFNENNDWIDPEKECADWWILKIYLLEAHLREKIEGLKVEKYNQEGEKNEDYLVINQTIDSVLSLLN